MGIRLQFLLLAAVAVLAALPSPAAAIPADKTADRVIGEPDFSSALCNNGGLNAASLCNPFAVALDAAGNLYVADRGNNRVLQYDTPLTSDLVADRVIGQPGFFTASCNNGGTSASSLCAPMGVAVDGAGNLYVTDALNHRVLEYDAPLTSDAVADRVFGQPSFTSAACNSGGISASTLCDPRDVAVDGSGNLYVADKTNHRVLEYDAALTDAAADRVFGQGGSFTSAVCGFGVNVTANSLCGPFGAGVDAAGSLYVADELSNRVLKYDTPIASGTTADAVFGQPSLTASDCNGGGGSGSATVLCSPRAAEIDGAGNLYVGDHGNHRVLEYDAPLSNTTADRVFGQKNFSDNMCDEPVTSASTLCDPIGVAPDGAGNLYVADFGNVRVLAYDAATGCSNDYDCDGTTNASDTDDDNDGIADASDNCPLAWNFGQENDDRNFVDLSPQKVYDDLTWVNSDTLGNACDADDDNDGLSDVTERGTPCASATGPTSQTKRDTDGDRRLDGGECALGYDPLSAGSAPPISVIAPDADNDLLPDSLDPNDADNDSDDDRVLDGVEFRYYNSNVCPPTPTVTRAATQRRSRPSMTTCSSRRRICRRSRSPSAYRRARTTLRRSMRTRTARSRRLTCRSWQASSAAAEPGGCL